MRALVVYESMFGNTHTIAERIATGLRSGIEKVTLCRVDEVDIDKVSSFDLLVVGGPTHMHGMSRPQTRSAGIEEPEKYAPKGALETESKAFGVREWLEQLPPLHATAVAFDTRAPGPGLLTGHASHQIARKLHHLGCVESEKPHSFIVKGADGLAEGEAERAEQWGREIARTGLAG